MLENPVGPKVNSGATFFSELIPNLVTLGFIAAVVIFFFVFITGAIQWMTSGGDKAAVETARGRVVNAFVGIVVLFLLYVILQLIGNFFGLDILSNLEINFSTLRLGN